MYFGKNNLIQKWNCKSEISDELDHKNCVQQLEEDECVTTDGKTSEEDTGKHQTIYVTQKPSILKKDDVTITRFLSL